MSLLSFHCRLSVLASAVLFVACATPSDGSIWACSAKDLVSARYDGTEFAFVHLSGFQSGAQYKVRLNDARTEATGTTGNGTPFTCKKGKVSN